MYEIMIAYRRDKSRIKEMGIRMYEIKIMDRRDKSRIEEV